MIKNLALTPAIAPEELRQRRRARATRQRDVVRFMGMTHPVPKSSGGKGLTVLEAQLKEGKHRS